MRLRTRPPLLTYLTYSTELSASLMVCLIIVFHTRHGWILVVAALFTLASHSLTSLLSVSMEARSPGWLGGGQGVQGRFDCPNQS